MQEMIFEKFRQIDASHTREHAGTGLGLAICQELAQCRCNVSFVLGARSGGDVLRRSAADASAAGTSAADGGLRIESVTHVR